MSEIRVRFAPSPTGYLHVGGLRTALYNYLFARKMKGKFILRIEDTDQKRFVEGASESLINSLKIMGMDFDEGPGKEGDCGPYFQSQRLEIYQEYIQKLIEKDQAYHCFCNAKELEEMRKQAESQGQMPKYSGKCRGLSKEQVEEKISQGLPYVIRMKIPDFKEVVFSDQVRGKVVYPMEQLDDQVLIKSDGFPTYHFANVVDDYLMGITHVIRGEEWLPSTPKHVILYKMFGFNLPKFAHLPLLLNSDRSKLSKRQGDVAVEDYLAKGFLPEALINFVALLGWNPGNNKEIFSLDQLIEMFTLKKVNKSGAVFDVQKLTWMNQQYIKKSDPDKIMTVIKPFLQEIDFDLSDSEKTLKIIAALKDRLGTLKDIQEEIKIFNRDSFEIEDEEAVQIMKTENSKKVIFSLKENIKKIESLEKSSFMEMMKKIGEETEVKKKELWMPVRIALTGMIHGPDVMIMTELFGKEKCLQLIENMINKFYN